MPNVTSLKFLRAVYPVPLSELAGQLAVWSRSPRTRKTCTDWAADLDAAVRFAERRQQTMDVYFGVALQDPDRALEIARRHRPTATLDTVRGRSETALVLPGVWVDLDVATGVHSSPTLPPDGPAALKLLDGVPVAPTAIVLSGGGYHVYWLFHEPWVLGDEDERRAAASLLRRVQWAVRRRAAAQGWSVDGTADLARVLRLPGTLNHKTPVPRPVVVETLEPARRYDPSDFDALPEPPGSTAKERRGPYDESFFAALGPADFRRVYRGCSWFRRCHEERRTLKEPDWFAALSIVGRTAIPENDPGGAVDGRQLAHRMSQGHPGYLKAKTDAKLERALREGGPWTCQKVVDTGDLAWERHCGRCPYWGTISSPILLGRDFSDGAPPPEDPTGPIASPSPGEGNPPSVPPFPKGGSSGGASDEGDSQAGARRSDGSPPSSKGDVHGVSPTRKTHTSQQRHEPSSPPLKKGELEGDSGGGAEGGGKRRQRIMVSHRENEVADQALEALVRREPNLFQRGGALVQVAPGDDLEHQRPFHRPGDGPGAVHVQEGRMRELLATHCEFGTLRESKKKGGFWCPQHPPQWAVKALRERISWPRLPKLEGVVVGPVLRPDGTVLQTPGYDRASGLYYAPGERFDPVPEKPSSGEIEAALERLRQAVCDFPFQEEVHFAGWLASLLTPLARFAFKGPSPLNLIDANVRGAGKSLLADVCHLIVTGRPAPRMAYLRDEAELRKAITTIALKARQMVLIDNVRGAFGSPTLDLALTGTTWEDRLLGQNVEVELPLLVTWYATGNNIELRGDLSRRCVHIRLESPEEKPEHRGGFRYPRLLDWLERERRHLLPAALTLLTGYCAAERPELGLRPWGSYESWSDLVRGAVVWLELPDPALTADGLESSADAEHLASETLARGLEELLAHLRGPSTAGEIVRELDAARREERCGELLSAIEELFPRLKPGELPTTVQLGNKLRSLRGRNFAGRVIQGSRSRSGVMWAVERRG